MSRSFDTGPIRTAVRRAESVLLWIAVWALAAFWLDNAIVLAGPGETLSALAKNLGDASFWLAVARSSEKIALGFLCAAAAGAALGFAASMSAALRNLLFVPVQLAKSVPIVCIVVILLISVGSEHVTYAVVAFVAAPPFYFASIEASRHRNEKMRELFSVFEVSAIKRFLYLTWPETLPFFESAAKTSVGMAWKAGVAAELIGIPRLSIGEAIYTAKLTLDTADLLAWTLIIVAAGWLCEKAVLALLRASRRSQKLGFGSAARMPSSAGGTHAQPVCGDAAIRICGLSRSFGEFEVLSSFRHEFPAGSRTCIMAPTGTGKTTLLYAILGLGADSGKPSNDRCHFSAVFQESRLFEDMSAKENVLAVCSKASAGDCRLLLEEILPAQALDRSAAELSGGMRRLAEIARALMAESDCVVLDEAFSGLDPSSKARAAACIDKHLGKRTLILTSHDRSDAALLGAEVLRLTHRELSKSA